MAQRLKLIVAYDGSAFAGWQSQVHKHTVQDCLEKAFQQLSGKAVRVHGSGRTDAGVHALGQCAHVDVESNRLTPAAWTKALNALLPPAVRVMKCRVVPSNFHARYSAKGKIYRYHISAGSVLPPFELGRVWHVHRPLNFEILQKAAQKFVGRHDFAGFSANRGRSEPDTVRTIYSIKARKAGGRVIIDFNGDGFLYKMVRMLVAALVQCAQGKITVNDLAQALEGKRFSRSRVVAPAAGLFLVRIRY